MAAALDSRSRINRRRPTLDPIATLQVPLGSSQETGSSENTAGSRFSVSSVCFLPSTGGISTESHGNDSGDDISSSSSDDEPVSFRCRDLVKQEAHHEGDVTADARNISASLSLSGTRLVSCHSNGDAFVWDLGKRRILSDLCKNRGQGMAIRRLGEASATKFFYQTRDMLGTVSIHDTETTDIVTDIETGSLSFCAAAPCAGNESLIVLPAQNKSYATVRDIRVPPEASPIVRFHGACLDDSENDDAHGMLMSLAMSNGYNEASPVVACGMESGAVFYHDLRIPGRAVEEKQNVEGSMVGSCRIKLGKDPVLGIDLASSAPTSVNAAKRSFVAIAGMAGDAAELSEVPMEERGTVAVIKTSFGAQTTPSVRLRARVATCQISGPDEPIRGGKPGVSVCRFRPDGRVFGVGGWDRRVRIFDRIGKAEPLAILKGHTDSVTALDWAPDSPQTGFLATGAGDGRIYIWRCFPS